MPKKAKTKEQAQFVPHEITSMEVSNNVLMTSNGTMLSVSFDIKAQSVRNGKQFTIASTKAKVIGHPEIQLELSAHHMGYLSAKASALNKMLVGKGIYASISGTKVTLDIALVQNFGTSQKKRIVATTKGSIALPGNSGVFINVKVLSK